VAERDLIDYIRSLAESGASPPWLSVGIGDDAAAAEVPGGGRFLVTTDMLVEGVHFEPGTPPHAAGRKAVARAHSDTAAMAARPLCTLAAASFPPAWSDAQREEFCRALWETAQEVGAPLIGGDLAGAPGPMTVTVTAIGTPGPSGPVGRGGARPGDAICVTGRLGGSILARHLSFSPRIAEALALAERVDLHAMIDVSDGLSTDALHIAEMSGVSVDIHAELVPVSADARTLAARTGRDPLWHALNDGEDYELLFCLPNSQGADLAQAGLDDLPVALIGEVTDHDESRLVTADGTARRLLPEGWEHR